MKLFAVEALKCSITHYSIVIFSSDLKGSMYDSVIFCKTMIWIMSYCSYAEFLRTWSVQIIDAYTYVH